MARPPSEHPTELELQILKILWDESPMAVREIRDRLAQLGRDLAHTSVITTLNTMHAKGQLKRRKRGNAFHFSPQLERKVVSQRMLGDLVNKLFDGSAPAVMLSLFDCSDVDSEDVRELRKLINRKAKEQQE